MSGLQGLQGYGISESESENEDSPKQQSDQEMGSGPGEDDQGQSPMDLDGVESDEETNPDAASEYSSQLRRLSTTGQMPQITIPPEPQGKIDPRVTEKVRAMYQKHKFGGINYNEMIKSKKSYRNSDFNFYSIEGALIRFYNFNKVLVKIAYSRNKYTRLKVSKKINLKLLM